MPKEPELTETELRQLVQDLEARFSQPRGVWDRCQWRRAHYHNLPEADPILNKPYDTAPKYQWDGLRRTHTKMRARQTESHFTVTVKPPRDTPTWRTKANDLEAVMNAGLQLLEERERVSLQGGIADGQGRNCYAVLHWCMGEMPALGKGDYEWQEELPEDEAEAKRYEPYEGRYRETEDARLERHKSAVARAGFPWHVELVTAAQFAFDEDRTAKNGMRRCLIKREVALTDYEAQLVQGKPGRLTDEKAAPPEDSPSAAAWGERVVLYSLWTRGWFYEVMAGTRGAGEWRVMNKGRHGYEMPPFALIAANVIEDESDPALKYEPYLEGLYRLKPDYDRYMTLLNVMIESSALPLYYLQHVDTGEFLLDDAGNKVTLARNSALVEKIPAGYELKKVEFDVNPAMVQLGDVKRQDLMEATPSTGQAEVSAATDPWAIRLQQAQASVEPAMYMRQAAIGLQTMVRNMALVMAKAADEGGFGETVWVYKDGKADSSAVVGVDPKDIVSLDVQVAIDNTSAAERITKIEHGRQLLADPNVSLTRAHFEEKYVGHANPDEVIAAKDAELQYYTYIKPNWEKMKLAQWFGARYVLGPNGNAVGMGGQEARPSQVLQANGWQPIRAPQPVQTGAVPGMAPAGGPPQTTMGGLPGLQAPNTAPMAGMAG